MHSTTQLHNPVFRAIHHIMCSVVLLLYAATAQQYSVPTGMSAEYCDAVAYSAIHMTTTLTHLSFIEP
jgi:hypothetical protein